MMHFLYKFYFIHALIHKYLETLSIFSQMTIWGVKFLASHRVKEDRIDH